MQRISPWVSTGLRRLAASKAPPLTAPAPTIVWISSINRMGSCPWLRLRSSEPKTRFNRCSKSPRNFVPASSAPKSNCVYDGVRQQVRNLARDDAKGEPLGERGLAYASLADEQGVILAAAAKRLNHALELVLAPDERIDLAQPSALVQVDAVLLKGIVSGRLLALAAFPGGFAEDLAHALAVALAIGFARLRLLWSATTGAPAPTLLAPVARRDAALSIRRRRMRRRQHPAVRLGRFGLANAVADVIEHIEARDVFFAEQIERLRILGLKQRNEQVDRLDFVLARALHVEERALDEPLDAQGGDGVLDARGNAVVIAATAMGFRAFGQIFFQGARNAGDLLQEIRLEAAPQPADVRATGLQGLGGVGLGEQGPENMLEREVLVLVLNRETYGAIQNGFCLATDHLMTALRAISLYTLMSSRRQALRGMRQEACVITLTKQA